MQFVCQRTERPQCITYIPVIQKHLYPTPAEWEASLNSSHGWWHISLPPKFPSTQCTITLVKRYLLRYVLQALDLSSLEWDAWGMLQQCRSYLHQPRMEHDVLTAMCWRLYTNIFIGLIFLWFYSVACKPYSQGVPYCPFCPLGYLFLSPLVGIACCNAPLWCTADGNCYDPPLVWVFHGFCRWICLLASQLFHMLYFSIDPLFCAWPGSLFTTANVVTQFQSGTPYFVVILACMMFGLLFLHFFGQVVDPIQFVLHLAHIVIVNHVELFLSL